jgi:hypothetical protein
MRRAREPRHGSNLGKKTEDGEVPREAQMLAFVVVVMFALAGHSALEAEVRRINVYVTCDGSDSVGGHLCFEVKEEIITSGDLQLVDEMVGKTGIGVHLVSVDASSAILRKGVASSVSVTFTFLLE